VIIANAVTVPLGIGPARSLWAAWQTYAVTESIAPAGTVIVVTAGTLTQANLRPPPHPTALAQHAE
jgi:hypothetical protein